MNQSMHSPIGKRPGGRSELVRQAVATAVLEFIQQKRFDFTYQEIANHAGINKTTLYRRWPERKELLREALSEHNASFVLPPSTSWHNDVEAMVNEMASFFAQPTEIALNLMLFNDPEANERSLMMHQWSAVQEQVEQRVKNAQSKGQLSRMIKPSTVTLMLLSPLLVLTLLNRKRADKSSIAQLIQLGQQLGQDP